MDDNRIIKLINIEKYEHDDLLKKANSGKKCFMVLCDHTYNDYNIGDYVKTDYGTFWKVTGITYYFRFSEAVEFDDMCWNTKEKLRLNQRNHGQREYSIIFVTKTNYSTAVGDLPDPGDC